MKLIILKYPDGTELGLLPELVGNHLIKDYSDGMKQYNILHSLDSSVLKYLKIELEDGHAGYVKDSLLNLKRAPIEYYLSQDPELSIQDIDLEDYK